MTDSNRRDLEDRLDRYARRELTPAEARELAQESLESPELFEELTWSGVAQAALPVVPHSRVVVFPRGFWLLASSAAAALVLIGFFTLRLSLSPRKSREVSQARPALLFLARTGQPLLLASDIDLVKAGAEAFRSPLTDSRPPQHVGSVVRFEDGLATINLGSLDNLAKGSELQIFGDARSTQPIGQMVVTTVFRETARGPIVGGQKIPIHSEARVAAAVYLGALLEQVDALHGRGDLGGARIKAAEAERWAETAGVTALDRGRALEKLAALEYLGGDGDIPSAEKHFALAVGSLDTAPQVEQSAAWNNLAVARLSNGDYSGAEAPLNQAVSKSPKTDIIYARSLNNRGVLAELRGDRRQAESLYADALRTFDGIANPPAQERQAIDTNLKRVKALH